MKRRFASITHFLLLSLLFCSCNHDDQQKTVFIGDSLVRNWDIGKYFPYLYAENRGVDGCRIEDCMRLAFSDENSCAVLLIGTNNLEREMRQEDAYRIAEMYANLVMAFQANKVYCISILPRNGMPLDRIELVNHEIQKRLEQIGNAVFVDVYDDFRLGNGINPEYTTDGTHLSPMGYELLTYKLSIYL